MKNDSGDSTPLLSMKRTLLVIALCVLALTHSRGAGPDDVAGVRWDTSPAHVRQILSTRPGVSWQSETPDGLTFSGGTFAGFDVKSWRFTFSDGKVSSVAVAIQYKPGQDVKGWFADQNFTSLQNLFEGKYGKSRATHDPNHQLRSWEFRDSLFPTATKTIELYRGWSGKREPLEVLYTYTRAKGMRPPSATLVPKEDI